jgi:hypothetical protein
MRFIQIGAGQLGGSTSMAAILVRGAAAACNVEGSEHRRHQSCPAQEMHRRNDDLGQTLGKWWRLLRGSAHHRSRSIELLTSCYIADSFGDELTPDANELRRGGSGVGQLRSRLVTCRTEERVTLYTS